MYISHIADIGLRALAASSIVFALWLIFEFGHNVNFVV